MKYIDTAIILNRKINYFVYVYIMIIIIIIIMLSLIIFFILFDYKTYYKVKGVVIKEEEDYYIRIYIPLDNIKHITNNTVVKINKKNYKYHIKSIDNEYYSDNKETYQIVLIDVALSEKYKINNLTLDLYFQKESKKIIDYIIRKE